MIIVPFRTGLSWSKDKHKTRLQNALNFLDFLGPYFNTANSRVLACLTKHTSPSRTPYICRAGRRSSVNWSNPCGSVMYVIFNSYLPMHCKNALILYQFGCFWKWMKMKICPKIVCLQWTLVWIYEGKKMFGLLSALNLRNMESGMCHASMRQTTSAELDNFKIPRTTPLLQSLFLRCQVPFQDPTGINRKISTTSNNSSNRNTLSGDSGVYKSWTRC